MEIKMNNPSFDSYRSEEVYAALKHHSDVLITGMLQDKLQNKFNKISFIDVDVT